MGKNLILEVQRDLSHCTYLNDQQNIGNVCERSVLASLETLPRLRSMCPETDMFRVEGGWWLPW